MKSFLHALVFATLLLPVSAQALEVRPGFDPGNLISDSRFNDVSTFGGPEGIQRFLESKGSVLANTSPDFLAKLGEPTNVSLKQTLEDPQPNLGRLRTAAELIWDASRASGMNPQVIIVTLHKEQGLIGPVSAERLTKALRNAMGFACPDASGCGDLFPTFYAQLFGNVDIEGNRYLGAAKSLMKSFNTPNGRGPTVNGVPATVGQAIDIGNTLGDYVGIPARQTVIIGNKSTAALYRYTPHVFNGNYNFWNFFTSWFKYPTGALLRSTADSSVYVIADGGRRRVPEFVAAARGLKLNEAINVSVTELNDYPLGPLMGPADNTVINQGGKYYVFIDGIKHPASSFVLGQRKLDPTKVLPITADEAALFTDGPQLTPNDGTVLKAANSPDVYLVDDGTLRKFSWFTFVQHGAAPKLQVIPDDEVASYPKKGFVAPKNGTVLRTRDGAGMYVVSESRRLPLTAELIRNHGIQAKNAVVLETDEELASLPVGPPAEPKEGTYFSVGKEFYLYKSGAKHPIYGFVAAQRGMKPDYSFEASIASNWPEGIAIPPKDGTLVKAASAPAVYVTENGQLRALTGELFALRKFSFKNVHALPDNEVGAMAKGGFASPPENTYFSVAGSGAFFRFEKGVKRRIFPVVAKQRGMTPDYTFNAEVADSWENGVAVAPRDGTLLRADGTNDYYLVSLTLTRPITESALTRRGLKKANAVVLPAADIALFAKGEPIVK